MRGRYGKARVVLRVAQQEIRTHTRQSSTYGILHGTPRATIDAALLAADCVQVIGDEFPGSS
jgi:hypothetical protein